MTNQPQRAGDATGPQRVRRPNGADRRNNDARGGTKDTPKSLSLSHEINYVRFPYRESRMPSVTTTFVAAMANAAGLTMSDDGALLSEGEVVYRFRPGADGIMPESEYFNALEWIRSTQEDEIALISTYAETIQLDDLGVLGLAIKTAPDLRSSMRLIERYFRLMTDTVDYLFDDTQDPARLIIEERSVTHPVLQFRNECALASFAHKIRCLLGQDIQFSYASFRHPCRGTPERYAEYFGCEVRFGADQDALALPSTALDLPVRLGDKAVSDFLIRHLDEEMCALHKNPPLMTDLMRHLSQALKHGLPQAGDIARAMGMSERTLYRRLSEEGLTYREALKQAQTQLAHELLTTSDFSIAEIAFLTGFSEQSTFSRAFKRWVGQAPAQYRQAAATQ